MPVRILILGGDADGNLGDRAILQAMCQEFRRSQPGSELTVVSRSRDLIDRNLCDRIIQPGARGLFNLFLSIKESSYVVCGGGGLFQDDDSLIKMPYWGLRIALIKSLGSPILGYSLGAGPLKAISSRWSARLALYFMNEITARDHPARETLRMLTPKHIGLLPDPALCLNPVSNQESRFVLESQGVPLDGRPLIGVAPRRWYPPHSHWLPHRWTYRMRGGPNQLLDDSSRLVRLTANVLDQVSHEMQAHVVMLPTYPVGHEGDFDLSRAILSAMNEKRGSLLLIREPSLYKGITGQLNLMLGGRMHPTILAASSGTPVVGLAYNPKFHGFFELLGLPDLVADVEEFVDHEQTDRLRSMMFRAMAIGESWHTRANELINLVRSFNDRLTETWNVSCSDRQ